MLTCRTRNTGRRSTVKLHWLLVEPDPVGVTWRALPGTFWLSRLGLTALQALGTDLNSPGCRVEMKLLLGAGLGSSAMTAITATRMAAPHRIWTRRRDLRSRAAAARPRPRRRGAGAGMALSAGTASGPACSACSVGGPIRRPPAMVA